MNKLAKRVPLLASLVLLNGCAKDIVMTANCAVGNHVYVSKRDVLTEGTAQDIEANNKSREAAGCTKAG